jgi:hypothetical protein
MLDLEKAKVNVASLGPVPVSPLSTAQLEAKKQLDKFE